MNNRVTVVVIDSRSGLHPDWVQTAISSVAEQSATPEILVINNRERKFTIGRCWNDAIAKIDTEFVLFLGDDDWLARDYLQSLLTYADKYPQYVCYTSYMTAYSETDKLLAPLVRITTGMWRTEYLKRFPFNEQLEKGIDREYIEEASKRMDKIFVVEHNFGYYYRKHEDYSCSGRIIFKKNPADIYALTSYPVFFDKIKHELQKTNSVFVSSEKFDPQYANTARVIFCDFLSQRALEAADYNCNAKKILRIHAYEVFNSLIHYLDCNKFHKIIFVSDTIRKYTESILGKIENSVVIPNGVNVNDYTIGTKNNTNICYAGYLSRKKGIGLIDFIARSCPEYNFHLAGKYQEDDVAWYFSSGVPDNVKLYPWQYGLDPFFADKTHIINTSLREGCPVAVIEGMAAGLRPVVYGWPGAEMFGKENIFTNIDEFRNIIEQPTNPQLYRDYVKKHFNFSDTYSAIYSIIKECL